MMRFLLLLVALTPALALGQSAKLTFEPAITTNGWIDVGLSGIVAYEIIPKTKLISYTAGAIEVINLSNQREGLREIQSRDSWFAAQRIGVGRAFISRRTQHTLYLMGGVQIKTFVGSYTGPDDTLIQSGGREISPSLGLMYGFNKAHRSDRSFGFRVYIPFSPYDPGDNILNITLEFGMNFRR